MSRKISNNNHNNARLTYFDVMLLFVLRAPDQRMAIAGLEILLGPVLVQWMIEYKHEFRSYQDWHAHLAAALVNAQTKVDATANGVKSIRESPLVRTSKDRADTR